MQQLRSFLQGEWVSGTGTPRPIFDATTGEPCAEATSEGLDLGAALAWGRKVGGASLRSMTFAERGVLLKSLSAAIHESRDELIELARINSGNTRGDAKFDIDGASSTLSYYAYLGKTLGDRKVLVDGDQEKLLRSTRLVGQHVKVPRQGVAIHINAFNFPAWGLGEKAAVALLAGVPVFVKPSFATATVTARVVEIWHERGLLPEGAVQLLVGSVGDLLSHVNSQDCVAFTGSGATGVKVRGHEAVVRHNVRVNIEADSLNASVVGPDVAAGSDTFLMFVADVARDLTQKAGQKCTAVRRIIVPENIAAAVVEALSERLDDNSVGDPSDRANRVGPLATAQQQRDVRAGIEALSKVATSVYGSQEGTPEPGYFVKPQLFRTDAGANAPYVHEHEVFGPVATIVTYGGEASEAIDIVAKGGGGLVASLYTNDVAFGGEVVLGIAPWSGRVMWGSKKIHDQSPGPGTVLPNLVHGGPGKAGGGEELGGLRGLDFYLQRTAIQGDRALLDRVFGKPEA